MILFKKSISEEKAAADFIRAVMDDIQDVWPKIYGKLRELNGDKFDIKSQLAVLDLALAVIALECQSLKNIFDDDQAERLYKWVLDIISLEKEYGVYAMGEIKRYEKSFQQCGEENPVNAIATRLLKRWFKNDIEKVFVQFNGKKLTSLVR